MTLDFLKALFPTSFKRALVLFFASFFLTVSIASCSGGDSDAVKSQANISTEDIAQISVGKTLAAQPKILPRYL